MQSLSRILTAFTAQDGNGGYEAVIEADWQQGRTLYGGLIAALANCAMRRLVPQRPLRSLQVAYVGPNAVGEVRFEPHVLRAGKAATLASCVAKSNGEVSLTVTAMYGAARESALTVQPAPADIAVPVDRLTDLEPRPGIPAFTQHYAQRWARGNIPFSRARRSEMSVYVRYRGEEVSQLTEAHALALMDAIPTPALAMLAEPGPASTLGWSLDILDQRFDFGVEQWWRLDAAVESAAQGYVVHSGHVVNPAGRVAAISKQLVTVYG
jgi:acyl-CoA thioesterase